MRAKDYDRAYPEDLVGQDFFKEDMLEKIGVTSDRLVYKFGSYKLPDVQECDLKVLIGMNLTILDLIALVVQ